MSTTNEKVGHTPGPWTIHRAVSTGEHPNHDFRFVGTADFDEDSSTGEIVAKLTDSPSIRENARLIASAPDLLAACKAALERIDGMNEAMGVIDELRAAIAKAEGAER